MAEWPEVQLRSVTTKIGSGATPRGGKEVYRAEGVAFIRSQNVHDGRFTFEGLARISDEAADDLRGVSVQEGDVLINITGESVTRTSLAPTGALPARVSQHVAIVRPDRTQLEPRYLLAALLNPPTKSQLNLISAAGATRRALTKAHLEETRIALPPLDEQKRIAGVLGRLDDLIETNRRLRSDLEAQLSAMFEHAAFDATPETPIRLDELIEVNPSLQKPTGDAAYVDMAALPTDSSRIESVARRPAAGGARFQNGDTLVARLTPCLENGKAAFVDVLDDGEVAVGSTEFLVLRDRGQVGEHWPYLLARSSRFRAHAIQNMTGTSGRQRCPSEAVERYEIDPPDPQALRRFRSIADASFTAIGSISDEIAELTQARDELLPLLMSGRVRVREGA